MDESVSKLADEVSCIFHPRSVEEVDPVNYLRANADVHAAGMDAREHFEQFGKREKRFQWCRSQALLELKEQKLSQLRFKRPALPGRTYGEPAVFVSKKELEQFDIGENIPESINQYRKELVDEFRMHPDKLFLDVGAGIRRSVFSNVVNTEIYPSESTDVVCVGEDLPFEDEQFDKVICFAVLEHTRRPWDVAKEIIRVLKPGGEVMIDYPFLQPLHGFPHHYFNATPEGLRSLFEESCDIESVKVNPNQSPIFALTWMLKEWVKGLEGEALESFKKLSVEDFLAKHSVQHLKEAYCKELSQQHQQVIAAGSFLIARKR